MKFSIDETLKRRRILITCGTGGVGKTTLSAALALRAAMLGKKAVVITIDPAKRLATSLGLESLGDHPTDLTPLLLSAYNKAKKSGMAVPPECTGTLSAIMPDTHRTFEDLIRSLTPSKEISDRIIRNPIFEILTREFSGSNEYMALQRLYALDAQEEFDCIILDTPPSRNTLAFLDAPKLMGRLFEERLIRWLVLPANKIVAGGMKKALGVLEKLTGSGFMTHLFDLGAGLFEVQVQFAEKLKMITALLESRGVGFLLVAGPTPDTAPELRHFIQSIEEHHFHFDGVAVNRTLSYLPLGDEDWQEAKNEASQGRPELSQALTVIQALQKREGRATEELLKSVGGHPIYSKLPELARDVHSVEDLFHVAMALDPLEPGA